MRLESDEIQFLRKFGTIAVMQKYEPAKKTVPVVRWNGRNEEDETVLHATVVKVLPNSKANRIAVEHMRPEALCHRDPATAWEKRILKRWPALAPYIVVLEVRE